MPSKVIEAAHMQSLYESKSHTVSLSCCNSRLVSDVKVVDSYTPGVVSRSSPSGRAFWSLYSYEAR